jgi:aminocarboxymuconate-semialdehyde decarboxylase
MMHIGCNCCGVSRRAMLTAGAAFAASAATGKTARAQAAPATPKAAGVRAIDIHAHYYSRPYLELIAAEGKRFNAEATFTDQSFGIKSPAGGQPGQPLKFINLNERLADMDEQGVAVQALSLTTPMTYWADADLSHRLSKTWNDDAIAAHKAHPDRFVVFVTLPMLDAERSIDELDRVAKLPGVRGVYMGTNINTKDLDEPQFDPIFARIAALDLPVFLHPLQTLGGARLGKYYLNNLLGNPYETGVAAARLIFGGVLDRHPALHVSLPHAGGVLPILIGRIDHGWKVRKETKHLANAPSTYLRRFSYDTIAHSKPIMEFVINQVGADRVMIGSDYCFDMGYERPLALLQELNVSTEQRAMILGGNAAKLLKL